METLNPKDREKVLTEKDGIKQDKAKQRIPEKDQDSILSSATMDALN